MSAPFDHRILDLPACHEIYPEDLAALGADLVPGPPQRQPLGEAFPPLQDEYWRTEAPVTIPAREGSFLDDLERFLCETQNAPLDLSSLSGQEWQTCLSSWTEAPEAPVLESASSIPAQNRITPSVQHLTQQGTPALDPSVLPDVKPLVSTPPQNAMHGELTLPRSSPMHPLTRECAAVQHAPLSTTAEEAVLQQLLAALAQRSTGITTPVPKLSEGAHMHAPGTGGAAMGNPPPAETGPTTKQNRAHPDPRGKNSENAEEGGRGSVEANTAAKKIRVDAQGESMRVGALKQVNEAGMAPVLSVSLNARLAEALAHIKQKQRRANPTGGSEGQPISRISLISQGVPMGRGGKRRLEGAVEGRVGVLGQPSRGLREGGKREDGEGGLAGWKVHGVRTNLLLLAQALDFKSWTRYDEVRRQLQAVAKPKGNATERTVNVLLEALELRREGRGYKAMNTPHQYRPIDARNATLWYATAHPAVLFNASAGIGLILPKIMGKPRVHIICTGYSLVSQVSVLLKLLNSSTTSSRTRLCRLRVTFIDALPLSRPGRTDYKGLFDWSNVGPHLISQATSLGLDLQFQVLLLSEDNLSAIDQLAADHDHRETVVVANAIEFQSISDDPGLGGGPLQHLMKTLAKLRPAVVAFVEPEADTGSSSFLQRFEAYMDHTWVILSSNDACTERNWKGRKWQHLFENIFFIPNVYGVLSCEGTERRLRPRRAGVWRRIFEFWGFRHVESSPTFLSSMAELVSSFPQSFSVLHRDGFSHLMWKDSPLATATAYECVARKGHY